MDFTSQILYFNLLSKMISLISKTKAIEDWDHLIFFNLYKKFWVEFT